MNDNDTALTEEQARKLLDMPSGSRPRIYGTVESGDYAGQTVALRSNWNVDQYGPFSAIWLSGTTLADLVRRA